MHLSTAARDLGCLLVWHLSTWACEHSPARAKAESALLTRLELRRIAEVGGADRLAHDVPVVTHTVERHALLLHDVGQLGADLQEIRKAIW